MTWYDPATHLDFGVGEGPTAAKLDKIGADLLALRNELPYCLAYNDGAVTIPINVWTPIPLNQEIDNSAMHDNATSNENLTIPEAGAYQLHAQLAFTDGHPSVAVGVRFVLNAVTPFAEMYAPAHAYAFGVATSTIRVFAASDVVAIQGYQNGETPFSTIANMALLYALRIGS